MSVRLEEITLKMNEPFYELNLWGVKPMKVLSEILTEEMQEVYDPKNPEATDKLFFAAYELENYIEDLEKTLDKLNHEYVETKKNKD